MNYILSQVSVLLATIFLGFSFLLKNKTKILMLCIMASIMFSLQYLFLDALTGMIINMLGIVRAMYFYIGNKKEKDNSTCFLCILIFLYLICTIITWEGLVSVAPLIASVLFTYSIWVKDIRIYKWMALPISAFWIVYNSYVGSIGGCILEGVLFVIEIVAILMYYKQRENPKK